jgi:hypothetical protein
LAFARDHGLGVSIRAGGHHVAGGALLDGGLVIDLSQMRSVRVDTAEQTVRAEGGALIGDVDREAMSQGLLVPLGLVPDTGIAGLTLAGGLGWARRKYGMSCDNLISADVVAADGRLLKTSAKENSDLFWALRGGGWDMGVVTSFEYQARPLPPEVFFAFVMYAIEDGQQVLGGFREFVASAPDEISPIAIIWTFSESEAFPRELWGRQFVGVAGPYLGAVEDGERVTRPLRELATPLLDMSSPMPYLAVQHLFDEDYPVGGRYYWKSSYLRALDDGAIDSILDLGQRRPSALSSLDIWALGGAIGRVGADETPIGHRHAAYLVGIEANWREPAADAANKAWSREVAAALAPFSTGGAYLNFEDPHEAGATASSHGPNFDRLVAVKRRYDPGGLFRSTRALTPVV